jgi:hypothetical protein
VFVETKANSQQRGDAAAFFTCVCQIHSADVFPEVLIYPFPNWKCIFQSFRLANGKHPLASGIVYKSLPIFLMKYLCGTVRFYHYQNLIQEQN